ncbi:MAG: radical SAM protein, partial [Candidatus Omnitrophota bacterium]
VGGIGFDNAYFSLRISDGCSWSCSYCSMKKAIGSAKSKPIQTVLEEVKKAVSQKKFKLNIISSDSGSYGLDIDLTLPQILKEILAQDERIVIEFVQDLNPFFFCKYKNELVKLIATGRIKSTSVPFQSGSERILKLMNRRLDFSEFRETIKEIKKVNPAFKLRTQVIIGFPTETDDDFLKTMELLGDCNFNEVDLFAYYEGDGTVSQTITPKVSVEVISRRMNLAKEQLKATPIRFISNYQERK